MGVGEGEYRRRAPEASVLHEAFRSGFAEVSEWLPPRVKREVVSYLRCGDVRYGVVEVTCDGCREFSPGGLQLQGAWVVSLVHDASGH